MTKKNTIRRAGLFALVAFASLAASLSADTVRGGAVKAYDFPGKYENRSAQGLAIYKDTAFLFNDRGHCRIYNLTSKKLVREFDLASAGADNHANCASFGVEFPKGNKLFPALYVAQCRAEHYCFVESVGEGAPALVQTLQLKSDTPADRSYDWVVDSEQKCIYTLSYAAKDIDKKGTNRILITKLPLPPLKDPKVVFSKADIIEQFSVEFANLTQGATIKNGFLYMPVGLHETAKSGAPNYKSREIIVVNLKTKKIEKRIDVNAAVKDEPEDAAFHGDTLLMYVGQKGGLYKINGL